MKLIRIQPLSAENAPSAPAAGRPGPGLMTRRGTGSPGSSTSRSVSEPSNQGIKLGLKRWLRDKMSGQTQASGPVPSSTQDASFVRHKRAKPTSYALPAASGPTLLAQMVASAEEHAAHPAKPGSIPTPASYFDDNLVAVLLQREAPKTESWPSLAAAPVERALESILADEVVQNMPAALMAPIATLGHIAADQLQAAGPERRLAWTRGLCTALLPEHPRPWGSKTPILAALCEPGLTDEQKADAAIAFYRQGPQNGYEAMAAMAMLRASYMVAERLGFASSTVPFIARANNDYVNDMLSLTGRIYLPWGNERPTHQGAGLTGRNKPSPIDASWMQPGVISSHLYEPNPAVGEVARALAYGNPYGVGISGSTNIFLYAAQHFNSLGESNIDLIALTAAMATMLCYNGGHSFHEAFSAAKMVPDAGGTSLSALDGYHPGLARTFFVAQADPQGKWLATESFARLAQFLLAHHGPGSP